jgi:hypothetical protein
MSAPARPPAWSRILRLHARIDDLTADAVGYLTAFEAAEQPERAAAIARELRNGAAAVRAGARAVARGELP